jgi:hypothetical protein
MLASKKSESMYTKRIVKLHKDIHSIVVWREREKKTSDRAMGWSATGRGKAAACFLVSSGSL